MRTFFGVSACILCATLLLILNNALENCMAACFNKTFLFIKGVLIYSYFLAEKKSTKLPGNPPAFSLIFCVTR